MTVAKMNPEAKMKILKEFRSNHTQCLGAPRKGDSYCAIGICALAYQMEHNIPDAEMWRPVPDTIDQYAIPMKLQSDIARWMKVYINFYLNLPDRGERSVVTLNDIHHITFPEFADLIEEQLWVKQYDKMSWNGKPWELWEP